MQTILNIKTDKKLKENAKKIANNIGVPLSTVINSLKSSPLSIINYFELRNSAGPLFHRQAK